MRAIDADEARCLRCSFESGDRNLLKAYVSGIPTFERATEHMSLRGKDDCDLVREWYETMEACVWLDRFGEPIRNWCALLERWFTYKELYARLKDPNRIPDRTAVRLAHGPRKADNWIGTPPDRIEDVF